MKSVLVANRGEIAVRIFRTARRLGLSTVAVYSDADGGAFHTRAADAAVAIGPTESRPYLDAARIVAAAREAGADAIHPGYGFLSENAAFAEMVMAAGLVWVGPPPAAIRAMGSKSEAKGLMERAGVPVVPGYHGELQDGQFLKRKAYEIGYPVLIKAVAGGGGKGMRRVDKALAFEDALAAAQREAVGAFGDARVLVEKFVERPRHIEVQVFSDGRRTVSLAERDCTVQRRHQKVIEEAPAPGMTAELRETMGRAAVRAAEAVGYVGAGTVEFIADGANLSRFFFMEMNTRLQVEHPVTEAVMGIDLVEWQFRVAAGEPMPLEGEPPAPVGHAVEARLYAEDPEAGFLPSPGRVAVLRWPAGVRVDAGVEEGDVVSPHYDPMIAKLVAHGRDRAEAVARLAEALGRTVAIGPRTNLPFLRAILTHPEFAEARHDTSFIDREVAGLTGGTLEAQAVADAAAALIAVPAAPAGGGGFVDPFALPDAFRITGEASASVAVELDGAERVARVVYRGGAVTVTLDGVEGDGGSAHVLRAGTDVFAVDAGRAARVRLTDQLSRVLADAAASRRAVAPMPGRITAVFVAAGETVAAGEKLFAIEAMKMEHTVKAAAAGMVAEVRHRPGEQVGEGTEVIVLAKPSEAPPRAPAPAGEALPKTGEEPEAAGEPQEPLGPHGPHGPRGPHEPRGPDEPRDAQAPQEHGGSGDPA